MYCFKKMRTFSRFLELIYDSAFDLGYQRHQNSVFISEGQYYVTSVPIRYKLNMILFSTLSVLFEICPGLDVVGKMCEPIFFAILEKKMVHKKVCETLYILANIAIRITRMTN